MTDNQNRQTQTATWKLLIECSNCPDWHVEENGECPKCGQNVGPAPKADPGRFVNDLQWVGLTHVWEGGGDQNGQ